VEARRHRRPDCSLPHTYLAAEHWQRRPALIHRLGGTVALYHGQAFDPDTTDLVPDGWSHDHCAICWWTLHDSGSDEERIGYTDERGDWVCAECYQQFLATKSNATGNA
jgi:hypothetical protein